MPRYLVEVTGSTTLAKRRKTITVEIELEAPDEQTARIWAMDSFEEGDDVGGMGMDRSAETIGKCAQMKGE